MRTAVYQVFDHEGALIYVGMTTNWAQRRAEHRRQRAWWVEVDEKRTVLESYPTAQEASSVERALIEKHRPRHNTVGVTVPYAAGTPVGKERLAARRASRRDPIDYTTGEHVRALHKGTWRHADIAWVEGRMVTVRFEMYGSLATLHPDQVRRFRVPYSCDHERPVRDGRTR